MKLSNKFSLSNREIELINNDLRKNKFHKIAPPVYIIATQNSDIYEGKKIKKIRWNFVRFIDTLEQFYFQFQIRRISNPI